jgi:hypothetical protein
VQSLLRRHPLLTATFAPAELPDGSGMSTSPLAEEKSNGTNKRSTETLQQRLRPNLQAKVGTVTVDVPFEVSGWRDPRLNSFLGQRTDSPFNLFSDALIRFDVISFHRNDKLVASTLLIVVHRLISDEWSLSLVVDDLLNLYKAGDMTSDEILPVAAPLFLSGQSPSAYRGSECANEVVNQRSVDPSPAHSGAPFVGVSGTASASPFSAPEPGVDPSIANARTTIGPVDQVLQELSDGIEARSRWIDHLRASTFHMELPFKKTLPVISENAASFDKSEHAWAYRPSSFLQFQRIQVTTDLSKRVEAMSRDMDTQPMVVYLAVLQTLLFRYTCTEKLGIHVHASRRQGSNHDWIVGPIAASVPVPAEMTGDPIFRDFLRNSRDSLVDALEGSTCPDISENSNRAHLDAPDPHLVNHSYLARAVDSVKSAGDAHDVCFSFLTGRAFERPGGRMVVGSLFSNDYEFRESQSGLGLCPLRLGCQPWAKFGPLVNLYVSPSNLLQDGGADIVLAIRADRFDVLASDRFADHYATLLWSACRMYGSRLSKLPILSLKESRELLELSGPDVAYPREADGMLALFRCRVESSPDQVAIIDGNSSAYTYREVEDRSNLLAAFLIMHLGLKPSHVVAIMLPRCKGEDLLDP